MSEINVQEAQEKIVEIQRIANKINSLLLLYLKPKLYEDENCTIELEEANKAKVVAEYTELKIDLEAKVGDLPE